MRVLVLTLAVSTAVLTPVRAQQATESGSGVYRLEFDISGGPADNTKGSRHYSMLIDESRKAVFQAGDRVPVSGGSVQYVDVGVKIESVVHSANGKIALEGFLELSNINGTVCLGLCEPIVGQRKIAIHAMLDPGTSTVLLNDAGDGARSPQRVEATITPVTQ